MKIDDFFKAVFDNDVELVSDSLSRGMNPNLVHPKSGLTPLAIASSRGAVDVAKILLDAGADPSLRIDWRSSMSPAQRSGRTALMRASSGEIVRLLVSCGASVSDLDSEGNSAIYHAVNMHYRDVFDTLVKLGADLRLSYRDGKNDIDLIGFIDKKISGFTSRPGSGDNQEIQNIVRDLSAMREVCMNALQAHS